MILFNMVASFFILMCMKALLHHNESSNYQRHPLAPNGKADSTEPCCQGMCSWCADNPRIIHMLRINSSNDGILFNQRNVEPGTRRRSFGGGCNLDDLVGKVQECLQKFQFVSSFHPLNSIFFTSSQTLGPHFRPF